MPFLFFLLLFSPLFTKASSFRHFKLKFINDIQFSTEKKIGTETLGGVSGISCSQNKIIALSDIKARDGRYRYYNFDITYKNQSFTIMPKDLVYIDSKVSPKENNLSLDFEGITKLKNQNFLFLSEHGGLFEYSRQGQFKRDWKMAPYIYTNNYPNRSFESLSITPSKDYIFLATEWPKKQDSPPPSYKRKAPIRVYKIRAKDRKFLGYYVYPLSKIPGKKNVNGMIGLSEILMLDDFHFLALERSFLKKEKRNIIKIFLATINPNNTIAQVKSNIPSQKYWITKKLILNLSTLENSFVSGKNIIDNMEGFCFGPLLPNNNKTLIIVSDNNFNKYQRTIFLTFEIVE